METLLDCKNKVARDHGFKDWDDYISFMTSTKVSIKKVILATDLVAEEYRKIGRYFTEDEIRKIQEIAYDAGFQVHE